MTPEDLYLQAVINRHRAADDDAPHRLRRQLEPFLRAWVKDSMISPHLESVTLSGSHPKSTALRDSDVDIFLSLSPNTPGPLTEIHASLAAHFRDSLPRPRNVSLRIQFQNTTIDLVPARRRPNSTHHTLWQLRFNTWLQTDVAEQTRHVRDSRLTNEIIALKLWTRRHTLKFPSFLQELVTIRAITPNRPIAESFLRLLEFIASSFPNVRLEDPANSNNVVSDLLTPDEKFRIAIAAERSLSAHAWPDLV